MNSPWHVQKTYTAKGISWRVNLPGTPVQFEAETEWGDEEAIEYRLIRAHAESLLGPIADETIQIDHVCGKDDAGHWFGRDRWVFVGNGATVWADGLDRRGAMLHLLANAIRKEEER